MATILLVEDDEGHQVLVEKMLRSGGHHVFTAPNGHEALRLLRAHQFEAVVTDLRMPLMNGLRLIRELRSAGDTIPIIAISGVNWDQLPLAQDYGANAALLKPLDRNKLLEVLDRVLSDTRSDWSNAWIHPEFGKVGDH